MTKPIAAGTFKPMTLPVETMFPRTHYFEIQSAVASARYAIWIHTPHAYVHEPERRFPMIIMPDGNGMALVSASVGDSNTSELMERIEPAIYVCIGYAGDDVSQSLAIRARDLLPPREYLAPGMIDSLRNSSMNGMLDSATAELYAHNLENPAADKYLAFLSEELLPFVARSYRVRTDDVGLFGHSYGGLFATYAALQPSSAFTRFGASSPGIIARHSVIFDLYRRAVLSELSARYLHMTVARRELTDQTLYQSMVGLGTVEYIALAGASPIAGVSFTSEVIDRETHISVTSPAIYSFLRALYQQPS